MRIRLGAPTFSAEYKDRIPNNEGLTDHVNTEIEYNLRQANKAYENALAADGVDLMLWRKTRAEGRRCTCKHAEDSTETQGSRFTDNDTPGPENSSIRVRGSWDDRNTKRNFHKETLGVDLGRITPDDFSGRQQIKDFPSVDQEEISAFLNGPIDTRSLQGGDSTTACGICLGTGFSSGYSLSNGVRLTFDTLNLSKDRGFTIDKTTRPFVFKTSGEAANQYLEWEFELPSYFIDTVNIQVRNNLSPAQNLRLLIGRNGSYTPATKQAINNLQGTAGKYTLRVEPFEPESRNLEFTHVELVLQFAPWIKTQIPQLQSTSSYASPETINNMELHLPPSVAKVSNEDIVFEYKYNKAWVVTDTTDLQTAKKQILDWTLQVKSLATFDVRSLVKISKVPEYGVSFDGLRGDY